MGDGYDSSSDIGADLSSDMGSDISSDSGADYGGDFASDVGADLGGDSGESVDARLETGVEADETGEDLNAVEPDEYGSSFNDRVKQTPINNGEWSGERGNSTWMPETADVAEQLETYGVDGIEYRDGFPDFSPVTEYEHQLPAELYESGDSEQFNDCNNALTNHLENNPEFAEHFDNDQLEAIRAGEKPSGFTWHHNVEPGNMQLVPTRIHQNCGHYGGKNVWGGGTTNRKYEE